ncbi:MAG TPA: response regulator transcription factor [Planctomycetota bacterium]|nr:response regulator transcription factor [Planctomycetota bacterium]
MANERVLVVDDEEDILRLVEYNLVRNGCRVTCVASGEAALKAAAEAPPDLVLLDLMLPGLDGFEVCRRLKADARTSAVPVVILSARGEEADVVAALELGADDYVTKPFSPRVLVARVKAVLRRRAEPALAEEAPIAVHGLTIDPGRRTVAVGGRAVELTNTEFRLLHLLARRPGWVFTRNQIIDAARGTEAAVTDRSVDVHVAGLRKKLGAAGRHIETIRGVGYRLEE